MMIASRFVRRSFLTLCLSVIAAAVFAQGQPAKTGYEPQVGQEGKDVVWVPTSQTLVDKMLDMAKVTPQDYVIDLGSGDGRIVIAAAKRGARALGIEYNPDMVNLAKKNATAAGVTDKASFSQADLVATDFSKAQVLTMFLLPSINMKLHPTILNMRPGTRVVSNTFTMEDWTPDQSETVGGDCTSWCTAHLWIVPAKVAGSWRLPQGELALKQDFQMLTGTLNTGGGAARISNAKMQGDRIVFTVGGAHYVGQVKGGSIEGTVKSSDGTKSWSATRSGKPG